MYIVTMNTENFTFMSAGDTEAIAERHLEAAFDRHLKCQGLPPFDGSAIEYYGVSTIRAEAGGCYRDGVKI